VERTGEPLCFQFHSSEGSGDVRGQEAEELKWQKHRSRRHAINAQTS
jgi:hypothetical protein